LEEHSNHIGEKDHEQELEAELSTSRNVGLQIIWIDICHTDDCSWPSESRKFPEYASCIGESLLREDRFRVTGDSLPGGYLDWLSALNHLDIHPNFINLLPDHDILLALQGADFGHCEGL